MGGRGGMREGMRHESVCGGSNLLSKHLRPTHSLADKRGPICHPVIRKWLRSVNKPESLKTPT